jgi:hypothetical protein
VLAALSDLQAQYFPGERADDTLESAFNDAFLDPKWRDSVAVPNEPGVYRLRALEVATFFELVDALKPGDIHVRGAANYGALTDDIYPAGITPPQSAKDLADTIQDRMPNRTVLEALSNVERWSGFARHFGPPGRLNAQIEDQPRRCVRTGRPAASLTATLARITLPISRTSSWPAPMRGPTCSMPFLTIRRRSRPRGSTPIRTDSRLPCLGLHTCWALS